jgi:trigger factor
LKILEQNNSSPCDRKMTIEVPAEEINSQVDDIYKELSAHAQLPGFRPGKAPMNLLKLRFGKKVIEEAREKAVEEACKKVLEDSNLKVIGEPRITPRDKKESEESQEAAGTEEIDEKQDKALTFDLEVEHIPEFEPADYDSLEVEIPDWSIKEETVQEVLENFQQRMAMIIPAGEDKVIEDGDIVGLSVEATCGGEPFPEATHDDYAIELGAREHLPGFEDALRGLKVGDETEIKIIMPDDYQLEKYKGQEAVFQVKVNQISTRQLPQIDDEFAKDMGEDSLDDLKKKIRDNLEQEAEQKKKESIKSAIRTKLADINDIPIPKSMLDAEFQYVNALHNAQLAQMGASMEDLGEEKDKVMAENLSVARQRVTGTLVMEKIGEKEELKINESDFFEFLEEKAAEQNMEVDKFFQNVHKRGMEGYYQRLTFENKVLEHLAEKAQVKEIDPEEWAEKQKQRDEALAEKETGADKE